MIYNKLFSNCPFINFKLRFQFPQTKLTSNKFGYWFNVFFGHTSLQFIWFFGSLNLKYYALSVPSRGKSRHMQFINSVFFWCFFFLFIFLRKFKVYERFILPFPIVLHFITFIAIVTLSLFIGYFSTI